MTWSLAIHDISCVRALTIPGVERSSMPQGAWKKIMCLCKTRACLPAMRSYYEAQ